MKYAENENPAAVYMSTPARKLYRQMYAYNKAVVQVAKDWEVVAEAARDLSQLVENYLSPVPDWMAGDGYNADTMTSYFAQRITVVESKLTEREKSEVMAIVEKLVNEMENG